MTTRPTLRTLMDAHAETETKLASLQTEMTHVKGSLKGLDQRVDAFENENRSSFNRVFDKLDGVSSQALAVASKPLPWNLFLSLAGILAAIGTAVAGGLLTLIIALAAWGGSYFSNMVESARREASVRLDALEHRVENRRDEK